MIILTTFALFAALMGGISLFGYRRYVRPARVHAQLGAPVITASTRLKLITPRVNAPVVNETTANQPVSNGPVLAALEAPAEQMSKELSKPLPDGTTQSDNAAEIDCQSITPKYGGLWRTRRKGSLVSAVQNGRHWPSTASMANSRRGSFMG